MPRVSGLGHLGIFVRDIERMTAFYRDFLGMQVTKQDPDGRMMFLSSDPDAVDHEIALMTGRGDDDGPPLIQQISLRVPSLSDLRTFHRNLKDQGYKIDQVVTHLSAIGCYFFDPKGNRTEVFWLRLAVVGHDRHSDRRRTARRRDHGGHRRDLAANAPRPHGRKARRGCHRRNATRSRRSA